MVEAPDLTQIKPLESADVGDSNVETIVQTDGSITLKNEPKVLTEYRQSLLALDYRVLGQRLATDRHYQNCFKYDLTGDLRQKIDFAKTKGMNLIFLIYGLPGTSKSYSALSLAKAIDPSFIVETNCYWDLRKFIDDLPNLKTGSCYVIDEVARNWGEGSFRVLSEINTVFETVRKRQIFIIVCTPRYFYSPTWSYCLEGIVGQISFERGKSRMALQTGDRKTLGYVLFNNPALTIGDGQLAGYEKLKDSFLDEILHKGAGSWMQVKAKEVEESEFFQQYIESMRSSGTLPSLRGLLVVVDTVFPHLRGNNEASSLGNCLLTWLEMGKYGPLSEFKRSRRLSRNRGRQEKSSPEDTPYLR
jgi:hypothetical protein